MKPEAPIPSQEWNIFARELKAIIVGKGYNSLWSLVSKAGVANQKVARLIQSLERPKSFPTLNREEMKEVRKAFDLSDEEMTRLIAAIMVTSIEASLTNKIINTIALQTAELILPLLIEALSRDANLETVKREFERSPIFMSPSPEEVDAAYEKVFAELDAGQIDIHLSYIALTTEEQFSLSLQARDHFMRAKFLIEQFDAAIQISETWKLWFQEVEKGLNSCEMRMNQLQKI